MTHKAAPRVLIVEDETSLRISLTTTLAAEGYQVVQACDGVDALEKLGHERIDLLLTDIRMPRKNGIELFHEVRKQYPNMPVVLMTAFANEQLIEEVLATGVFTIVEKPFDIERMLDLIASVLHKPTILIVDGVAAEATAILKTLRGVGLLAEVAPDAAAALSLMKQEVVDACVLDLEAADGLAVAQLVDEQPLPIQVVAIIGQARPELLKQAGRLAGEHCLRRPLSLPDLIRTIARVRQPPARKPRPTSLAHRSELGHKEDPPVDRHQITEKVRQEMRHALNNRLLVIRTSSYYLRKAAQKAGLLRSDPKVEQMFALIDDAVKSCAEFFGSSDKTAASPSPLESELAVVSPVEPGSAQEPADLPPPMLIVDDAENNRLALQALLEDCGFLMHGAASVAEARVRLLAPGIAYRLVFLDQQLEDGLGTDLIPLIRERHPDARILLFSGSVTGAALEKATAQVDAAVPKGEALPELLAVVDRLLSSSAPRAITPSPEV